jgi:protein phosphatase
MRIEHAATSDVGMKRDHNEDNFLELPEENLFAVCDGMGGHAAGEVASKIAVEEIGEFYRMTSRDAEATWPFKMDRSRSYEENRIVTAIKLANQRIIDAGEAEGRKGMGTTTVAVHFAQSENGPELLVAHVGDSRIYRFRKNHLERLTIDHSLVEEYIRMGKLTVEEAKNFPQKNIILRALGQQRQVDVEVNRHVPEEGDVILLCSDGLSGMVTDERMEEILQRTPKLEECTRKMIDAANAAGGVDNITCVLAQFFPN